MTTLIDPFPDIELALITGFKAKLVSTAGQVTVKNETPSNLEDALPFVAVSVLDDSDDDFTRRAQVDVDVYAATRADGYALSEQVRGLLKASARLGGVTIDRVLTTSGPKRVPWDNPGVRRFFATYRISTRR